MKLEILFHARILHLFRQNNSFCLTMYMFSFFFIKYIYIFSFSTSFLLSAQLRSSFYYEKFCSFYWMMKTENNEVFKKEMRTTKDKNKYSIQWKKNGFRFYKNKNKKKNASRRRRRRGRGVGVRDWLVG